MDTEARLEAARRRLEENRAVLLRAKGAGPPCSRCAYFDNIRPQTTIPTRWEPLCRHPSLANHAFDPVFATVSEAASMKAAAARADDGPCGPEAVLFDNDWKRAPNLAAGAKTAGYWVAGGFSLIGLLEFLSLFGFQ